MTEDLTARHLAFFGILLAAFVLLATERIRNDVVAILLVLSLVATRLLEPKEALAGLSGEPAIVVASVCVLSAGLQATGVSTTVGRGIGRAASGGYARAGAPVGAAATSSCCRATTTPSRASPRTRGS